MTSLILAARATPAPPARTAVQGLWTLTLTDSSRPKPRTERICIDQEAVPAELWTCAGRISGSDLAPNTSKTVACDTRWAKARDNMSLSVSKDGLEIRQRLDQSNDLPPPARDRSWSQSVMTFAGQCPVLLRPDQPFVIVGLDGTVQDPFEHTGCMIEVLKTVEGVTGPRLGVVRDPSDGLLPFVEYDFPSRFGGTRTVTFVPDSQHFDTAKVQFAAQLSGFGGGDDLGTQRIKGLWKDRCRVTAATSFYP
jgi:hypothetical protein